MRTPVVVDTNVLLVANGGRSYSKSCALACAKRLFEIQKSGQVVLDYGYEILKEYAKNQRDEGQPGPGFQFWKWLVNTKGGAGHCEWVTITKLAPSGYREFPSHQGLLTFDPSDQKFVAAAKAHSGNPPILQAADSKWWGWNAALAECGVIVEFLCPEEIQAKFRGKMKKKA